MRRWRSSPSTGGFLSVRNVPVPCSRGKYFADFELSIGANHGIWVDGQVNRQLPHSGQLIARPQGPGRDAAQHLIDDLTIRRNATAAIQGELERRMGLSVAAKLQCTSLIIHCQ